MTDVAPSAAPAAKRQTPTRRRAWLFWLLLLLLVLAVAVGWVGWRQLHMAQQQLAQTQAQSQTQQRSQQQALAATQQQTGAQLASLQDQVHLHSQKLAQMGEGGTTLWRLNEAKSLASLAQQRLLLTADLPAAQQLLAASDKVLAYIDDPSVLPARRALAQDMQKLAAAQQLDTTALLLQLGALIDQLRQLTLPQAHDKNALPATDASATTAAGSSWWQRLLARLPLSIQRSDAALPLPLAAAQLAQVRLSLGMDLQQAQLALLQGRAAVYTQALTQADAILSRYFSAQDANVKSLRAALARLKAVHINQALPQIGAGLEAIQALLHPAATAQGG